MPVLYTDLGLNWARCWFFDIQMQAADGLSASILDQKTKGNNSLLAEANEIVEKAFSAVPALA